MAFLRAGKGLGGAAAGFVRQHDLDELAVLLIEVVVESTHESRVCGMDMFFGRYQKAVGESA